MAKFKHIATIPRTKALEKLSAEELVQLLPKSLQKQVARANKTWEHIDDLAGKEIYDPSSNKRVNEKRLTKEEILLLFDPEMIEDPTLSKEDNLLRHINTDPVLWSRYYLSMNPRLGQILVLRDDKDRKVLRFGRRCGKTTVLAIRMLFKSWTNPGNKSILIAPMKAHAGVTWDMIKEMIRNSPELTQITRADSFRMVEQPNYRIVFPNGSMIQMFTSGVRSSGKADVVRGQEADDIYLDEVDLMDPGDFPGFISILRDTGRGKKTMFAASTPNGRRDMMYKFSTTFSEFSPKNKEIGGGFREFYFPTHTDLNYSPKDDAEQRAMLTFNNYLQEVLADYGEEAAGVFLKAQIDRANELIPGGYKYWRLDYGKYQRDDHSKLVVGVDWDKYGAGTNIVVCKWDRRPRDEEDVKAGRLMVIARYEVPRSMTTLHDGVELVKDINYTFSPDAIYVDRGYGELQVEELILAGKEGKDPRCIGLDRKVRGIHFSSSVEIHDPVSHQPIKKEIKDHMVTLSSKLFENNMVILNAVDFEEVPGNTDLSKQFEQYLVVGKSIYGKPRYEPGDVEIGDHALDGFMLCALAVDQEWGDFSLDQYHVHPKVIKKNLHEFVGNDKLDMKEGYEGGGVNLRTSLLQRSNVKQQKGRGRRTGFRRSNV